MTDIPTITQEEAVEVRARELLAVEHDNAGFTVSGAVIRDARAHRLNDLSEGNKLAIRAITAALSPNMEHAVGGVLRPEVLAFAHLMERQLCANDHKAGWKDCQPEWLHKRMLEEASELLDARLWKDDDGPWVGGYARGVGREAADVANFAMMIADVCGALGDVA